MDVYPFRVNSGVSTFADNVTLMLFPDGRGETNKIGSGLTSTTKWSQNRLTRRYRTRMPVVSGGHRDEWKEYVTEKFTLSKDGTKLSFEAVSSGNIEPPNPSLLPWKLVFKR